jgi:hypothetical protein
MSLPRLVDVQEGLMASDELTTPRSRRALLAAAAGAAGALAAQAAMPLAATAAPTALQTEQDNPTIAATSVTQGTLGSVAFKASTTNTDLAGLVGATGDQTSIATDTSFTGIYGWSPTGGITSVGAGVWGDSDDIGVAGSGAVGVYGYGSTGVVGEAASSGQPGVLAFGVGQAPTALALQVVGKVKFSRSGRTSMASGAKAKAVSLAGVTATSKVFAVLATSESGRWVRAVVPAAGKFSIYLNTTLTSSAVVSWFVLD